MTKQNAVTTEQLQWLLERINASSDPITREQVRAFGHHPGGPILPDGCMKVERLPSYYGTRHEKRLPSERRQFVHDLAVCLKTGELWLATVVMGRSVLENHGDLHGRRDFAEGRGVFGLLEDEDDGRGTRFSPRIVGFQPHAAPVAALTKVASGSGSRYWEENTFLFVADRRVFERQLPKQHLLSVRVTSGGDIVTVHEQDNNASTTKREQRIFRNGEFVRSVVSAAFQDAWMLDDGKLVVFLDAHTPGLYKATDGAFYITAAMPTLPDSALGTIVNVRGLFQYQETMHVIVTTADTVLHARYVGSSHNPILTVLGANAYVARDVELPDGRWTYVGKTTRDNLQCMVADGVTGPGFDLVSNAFVHDGAAYYYGVLGQHLFLMDLPPRAATA